MTSFFLFLGDVFIWSFGLYDLFGNVMNWILFAVASILFIYWCYVLVVKLGNSKDYDYEPPSKDIRPYYDPKIYKKD